MLAAKIVVGKSTHLLEAIADSQIPPFATKNNYNVNIGIDILL